MKTEIKIQKEVHRLAKRIADLNIQIAGITSKYMLDQRNLMKRDLEERKRQLEWVLD